MEPEKRSVLLNVAGVIVGSYTNGPGKRVVIWVQGCTIGCPGCFNTPLQPHEPHHLIDPVVFARTISEKCVKTGCEGITITGGEPFQQAVALSTFTSIIRESDLTIVCFSGYCKDALFTSTDVSIQTLIGSIDILIAGPYNHRNRYPRTWSDDPDKEYIFLSDAYSDDDLKRDIECELLLSQTESRYTGFFDFGDRCLFEDLLSE